jgi:hydrogenase nickel incorporation protein HypA/HybF
VDVMLAIFLGIKKLRWSDYTRPGTEINLHEASIAVAIVEEIALRAAAEHIEAVTEVRLRVGVLTSVVPDALQFAWEPATNGTVAEGSRLRIERSALTIACDECACERTIDSELPIPVCPVCGRSSNRIVRGRELLITAMEVRYAASRGRDPSEHPAQERSVGARSPREIRT